VEIWWLIILGEILASAIESFSLLLLLLLALNSFRLSSFSTDSFFFLKLNLMSELELLRLVLLLLEIY